MYMKRKRLRLAIYVAITIFTLWSNVYAEEPREWLVLDKTENGQPVIVRSLGKLPDDAVRKALPWRLTVTWHYEKKQNGLPTEVAIQLAREIEDGLLHAIEAEGKVDLPLISTGNGVRYWYFYVQNTTGLGDAIRTFFDARPGIDISAGVQQDEEWNALREVIGHVQH